MRDGGYLDDRIGSDRKEDEECGVSVKMDLSMTAVAVTILLSQMHFPKLYTTLLYCAHE